MSKLIGKILRFLPSFLIIAICMPIFVVGSREIGKYLGLVPLPVNVLGTGSMYPSLYWDKSEGGPDDSSKSVVEEYRTTPHLYRKYGGITLLGRSYLKSVIGYGDMVAFENGQTHAILTKEKKDQNAGFIKRIIGVPGDKIELKDGYVIKNGVELSEPYIYKPRSTYGDVGLPECNSFTIPDGSYLVMGDNRKVSSDSRGELGLIKDADISYYLPFSKQGIYHSLWRDTSADVKLAGTASLSRADFYTLINEVRKARGLKEFKVDKRLENSSTLQAKELLNGNKNYSSTTAMSATGYSNIITSEFSIKGRFTASELIENLLYFKDSASSVLDPELSDIGISDINLEVNGCPSEVIVGHLGGYKPADYSKETLDSWKQLKASLQEILPSWEKAVEYTSLDQNKLRELLALYHKRLDLAGEIVGVMENRVWLSKDQEQRIKNDEGDAKRAEELAKSLNGE